MRISDLFRPSSESKNSDLRGLMSRLVEPIRTWRQQSRQWTELEGLERDRQLAPMLSELGLPYGQLQAFVRAHPRAARLRAGMMRWLGLDPARVATAGETRDVEWRCIQCKTWRECRDWLASPEAGRALPTFCPNMETFNRLLAAQARSRTADPAATGHASHFVGQSR